MSAAIDLDDYDNTRSSASLVVGAPVPLRLGCLVVVVVVAALAAAAAAAAAVVVVVAAAVAALADAAAAAAAVVAAVGTVATGDGRQWFEWEEDSEKVARHWIRWGRHDMARCPGPEWEVDTRRPTLRVKDRNVVMDMK